MHAMHRAAQAALLGLLLTIGAPLAVAGGHMTAYHASPEHDDIGRSNEPDGAATSIFGALLGGCNVDQSLDGQCEPGASAVNPHTGSTVAAPGCSSDAAREPSGTCWLFVQTGLVGTPGLSGNRAPGAFTPTKGTQVRFFDLVAYTFPLRAFIDHNNKLADLGVDEALRGLDPNFGGNFVNPGPAGWSAWYGTWQDKNGNGVIDYLAVAAGNPANPQNEFTWIGECGTTVECVPGHPNAPVWFYPGNHHAFATPDVPGLQLVCFATFAGQVCSPSIETIDEADEDFEGDPLLGPQGSLKPDSFLDDRTDDAVNGRHYTMGNGFPLWHYDQSLIVREVVVAALDPAQSAGGDNPWNPAIARFRDVDVFPSWNPLLEELVVNSVKAPLRSEWVSVRDGFVPTSKWADGAANNAALDTTSTTGPVDDLLVDPGRSREPNHAQDQFPGASRGVCTGDPGRTHQGFCNSYAGHMGGPHAFADAQLTRAGYLIKPRIMGTSVGAIYGPQTIDGGYLGTVPRLAGDHSRSLGPGFYDPLGNLGVWTDRAHPMSETVLDPVASVNAGELTTTTIAYNVGKDGWIGNIVNTTGLFRYRGYAPESCTIFGVSAVYEHAQCDPYSGGSSDDPQSYGSSYNEFAGRCNGSPGTLTLLPEGGIWTAPTFVWRDIEQAELVTPEIEDFTGSSNPITLKMECIAGTADTSGNFVGRDSLLLPLGNPGMGVFSRLETPFIAVGQGLPNERVVDVDYYAPG